MAIMMSFIELQWRPTIQASIFTYPHLHLHRPLGSRDRLPSLLSQSAMPKKTQNPKQVLMKTKNPKQAPMKVKNPKQVPYQVLVNYRNASTKWKWASIWVTKYRPRYAAPNHPNQWEAKPMSQVRRDALRVRTELEIYMKEVLQQRVADFLHP